MVHSRAKAIADLAAEQATEFLALYDKVRGLIAHNEAEGVNWGEVDEETEGINLDDKGNIDGTDFTPVKLSNVLGTFTSIVVLMNAGHRGNLELIAKAKR